MKVVIIEDEVIAADNTKNAILAYHGDIEIIKLLRSVSEAIRWLSVHLDKVDILFMDIKLTDGLSFDIFDHVTINKPIIFTTAYDEYALKAFEVNSIDYLLKPITEEDVSKAIEKFKTVSSSLKTINYKLLAEQIALQKRSFKKRFLVKSMNSLISINIEDIAFFLAEGNFVCLRTFNNKTHAINYSLENLEEILSPELFFRATRNIIVNIQSIQKAHPYFKGRIKLEILPEFQQDIIISNKNASLFKEWMNQ